MNKLLECVPNFSEGRNMSIIKQITDAIESVDGIKLLDVDPGQATNRTVVTFVGAPENVLDAATKGIQKAAELIDMRKHTGAHPRMGACDVCPLIPIAGLTMQETVKYAHKLGERIGKELHLSGYFYEFAATQPKRKNLAYVRAGEYEGLRKKIATQEGKTDFGTSTFNAHFGAVAISARNFLVAYNINLNTTSTRRANAVAFDVREKGRIQRKGNPLTGEIVKDKNGQPKYIAGTLKSVKAIGWYIEEYGVAQISMNLTDITITSIHQAFDEVCKKAEARGLRVTGSELVGLLPLQAMLDAGRYFLRKQNRSVGVPDGELIKIAIKSLGLDELKPFNPNKKIIEYLLEEDDKKLVDMTVKDFTNLTSSEMPAPGGGSVSANIGALGVALATMVANLSAHKRGWDENWEYYSQWAEKGQQLKKELIRLTDEDTNAFNKIMLAFSMPKTTKNEQELRITAIEKATLYATEVPLKTMESAYKGLEIAKAMASKGLQSSISDAGVGALAIQTAVHGAFLNVKINAAGLKNKTIAKKITDSGNEILKKTVLQVNSILDAVDKAIAKQT